MDSSNSYDSGAPMGSYDSGGGISIAGGFAQDAFGSSSTGHSYASGGGPQKTSFFSNSSQSKYDDLKQMLESSKEVPKLEAMKRIITMVAKGRSAESARELFPAVVKNVVTKNSELKKLVYLYLTRYAEQEPDLALLSIATFQHALKDPNPLIRGSAIRVLSSIRVPMISPIMLIAIKDCANDMSPYVRKTAAHAIPKLYSLDPDIREDIVEIIAKLLQDKVSLVLGSAVAAFEEVCPDRFDLIHENYRKLCQLLVDVDEWGQILIINMLLRYARTQFVNPNGSGIVSKSGTPSLDPDHVLLFRCVRPLLQSRNSGVVLAVIQLYLCAGPQHEWTAQLVRPLIRLLHSHREIQLIILKNIVTLTSAEFNDHLGALLASTVASAAAAAEAKEQQQQETKDASEAAAEAKKKQKTAPSEGSEDSEDSEDSEESEDDILEGKASSGVGGPAVRSIKSLFEPYLKSFFVKSKDSTQTKILKLEILTNLSNSANISLILREFQAYIVNLQDDLEFMSATIESIGQCASRIKEIAPVCLNGLLSLLSNRNESIVAQSIVVLRSQIINKDASIITMIVRQTVKLLEKIRAPQARATIVWIVAEFAARNGAARRLAPDVLRRVAKSFASEDDLVKLQALNLAAKLHITTLMEGGASETKDTDRLKLLISYVFNLAKYDLNYDVRDRGRFLKQLLSTGDGALARRILLVPKLVPNVTQRSQAIVSHSSGNAADASSDANAQKVISPLNLLASSVDSSRYRVGTLSHFLGKKASEYEELPDWPLVPPDPSFRRVQVSQKSAPSGKTTLGTSALAGLEAKAKSASAQGTNTKNGFLLSSEEEEEDSEDEEEDEEDEEDEESDEEESDEEESDEEEDDDEEEESEEEEEVQVEKKVTSKNEVESKEDLLQ